MRKQPIKTNIIFLKSVAGFFVFLSFLSFGNIVKAEDGVCSELCGWEWRGTTECQVVENHKQVSAGRTTEVLAIHKSAGVQVSAIYGKDPSLVGACSIVWKHEPVLRNGGGVIPIYNETPECINKAIDYVRNSTAADDDVATAFNAVCNMSDPEASPGSAVGLTSMALNTVESGDIPVNLAYYAKKNMQKIPLLKNTAYAADYSDVRYKGMGLGLAYVIWEGARDLAYSMMAIVMLILGIMIITRRKLSPQVVVSVQTALPRVLLSLFLITFSYPIGAVMASMINYLTGAVMMFFLGNVLKDALIIDINLLGVLQGEFFANMAAGVFTWLIAPLVIIMVLLSLLVAIFKALLVYIKIIVMIAFAPLQFAWAALPGQESVITDWFKQMAAHILAIPAIIFYIGLAGYIFLKPFTDASAMSSVLGSAGIIDRIYTMVILPILVCMVLFQSISADKKIAELIGVGKKKK